MLHLYEVEVDGHFHGGRPVRPWVARVSGPCARYGLVREFLEPKNEWSAAHRTWSGRTYGVVATWHLRPGLYEAQRCRGKPSRRRVVREFFRVTPSGAREDLDAEDLLDAVRSGGDGVTLRLREDREDPPRVGEVIGLGAPAPVGFVLRDGERVYRLREGGVFEVTLVGVAQLYVVAGQVTAPVTQHQALALLEMTE